MKKIVSVGVMLVASLGCSNNPKSIYSPDDLANDSLKAVIDSIRLANTKNSSVGKHSHIGLAEQAHQNPVKKNRMTKNSISVRKMRVKSNKERDNQRRQRMIDLGIMDEPELKITN